MLLIFWIFFVDRICGFFCVVWWKVFEGLGDVELLGGIGDDESFEDVGDFGEGG